MKKLINDPRNIVQEMLEGYAAINPGLVLLDEENVILRAGLPDPASRAVAVLSGGGSGHEPAHAGYVGPGLLTAAIAGDVFTSPSVDQIHAAIMAAAGPAGAVLIVKNYTGDRLNFALAAELAHSDGIPCEIVVVADDVALRDTVEPARRRGIAGTVLIHKVTGAAAAMGKPLVEVATLARSAAAELGSMGVALGACTVPAAGQPGFTLGSDEIELGLGIHGEKGVARSAMRPASALVETILETIIADRVLLPGDRVALLVNGLGGTPPMELAIVAGQALAFLRMGGLVVERAWAGNYLTALEMAGCSLSLLRLDDARLALLDYGAQAPAWIANGRIPARVARVRLPKSELAAPTIAAGPLAPRLRDAALAVAAALDQAEPLLTDLDSQAGDGDLGASMARGAAAIRALPESAFATPSVLFSSLCQTLRRAIAGSSGPFYATALLRAARRLEGLDKPNAADWRDAFTDAVAAVREIGGAKPGDRTMVDALQPAADALANASDLETWKVAVAAAEAGAERTADMLPRLGRASYLGARALGVRDGGAVAVAVWMRGLFQVINRNEPRD
jgi:ATP-dependent dihydroxyacetone kinase